MRQPDVRKFLWDADHACELALRFTEGRTLEDYRSDELLRSAVERQLVTLGEALNQLARIWPESMQRIPDLRAIVGFRNVLVHGYSVIDDEEVWRVLLVEVPRLRQQLQALLSIQP